jgi:putative FmdB family regulatory protein
VPIYEYRCEACGERTEALQKLNDSPLRKCQRCGGRLRKMVSAPSFQFKGSGWYATDYASKKGGEDGGAAKDKDAAADAKPADSAAGDGAKAGDSKTTAEATAKETKPKSAKPAATAKEPTGRSGKPTPAAS